MIRRRYNAEDLEQERVAHNAAFGHCINCSSGSRNGGAAIQLGDLPAPPPPFARSLILGCLVSMCMVLFVIVKHRCVWGPAVRDQVTQVAYGQGRGVRARGHE